MRARFAFTLVEVIVVIVIIALLAALAVPVYIRAKQSANETICLNNLKQIYSSIELYRADWGSSDIGRPAQMGLPFFIAPFIPQTKCRGLSRQCQSPGGYNIRWPIPNPEAPLYSEEDQEQWADYVQEHGPNSVLAFDDSHQDHCPRSELSRIRAIGLNLTGSVFWRSRRGDPSLDTWWHEIPRGGK